MKNLEKWREAGKIGSEALAYAKSIVKKDMKLLELAKKVESFIKDKGAKFAFPINLSVDAVAAHSSPGYNDEELASGLLKIDVGVSKDGFISDLACSVDLTEDKKHTKLIEASRAALNSAIKLIKPGITLGEIGKKIQETIESFGFAPIINLCGHQLKQYKLHAGFNIPNYDNGETTKLEEGMFIAIEPFATSGTGLVQDGRSSGIYKYEADHKSRDHLGREILSYVKEEFKELPFSGRWMVEKYGAKALFSLRALEQVKSLHNFKQLVEKTKAPVSQAEATILVTKDGCEVLAS